MKRILSMLLVLCMVISMLPLAVFAADTFTGTATADGDGKYTKNFTPGADGTLTVTVGDGTTNWSADVAFFGDSLSMESVGTCSGSESDSFSAEVVAGTKYYVRVWATDGNGLSDTPVSYTFVPASGEEDAGVVVEGAVLKDDAGAAMKGTDVEIPMIPDPTGNAPYAGQQEHFFTPTTDGILTVHIIGSSSDWWYSGENLCGMVTGSGEWAETYEVRAGTTYSITLGCYEDWNQASGTISYEVLFYAKELAAVQEKFMFADSILVGEKAVAEIVPDAEAPVTAAVTMMDNAASTVVGITPDVVGVYTVTVSEGATIADMGTNGTLIDMIVDSVDYGGSVVWTCKEVSELKDTTSEGVGVYTQGQTLFVGIKSDAETVHVTVEKTGDYEAVEVETLVYENKAELSQFVLPEEAILGDYINVSDSVDHVAVLGNDGYYHLDSEDGDILLVDMDYASIVLTNALSSERPVMNAYATLEDGTRVCYNIADAVKAYEAVCDENGYYPLTEDLVLFYDAYAVGAWVYGTVLDASMMNDEDVWMYCMRTMTLPGEEGGDAATSGTLSVPSYESVDWTAPASGTVNFTVTPAESTVPVFLYGELAPLLLITNGTGSMEVTEGVVYEFMDADGVSPTIEWAYEAGEEPEVPSEADGSYMNPYIYETMDALIADWQGRAMSIGQEVYIVAPLCGYTVTLSDNFDGAVCFLHSKTGMILESPYTFEGEKDDTIMVGLYNRGGANQLTISAAEAGSGSVEQGDGTVYNPYTYASIEDMVAAWTSRAVAGETTVYIQAPVAGLTVSVKDNYGAACFEDRFGMEIMNSITFDAFAGNPVMFALKNRAPFETNVTLSVGGAQGGEVTYTDLILNDDMSVEGQDCHWTFTAPDPGVLTLTTGGAIMGPVAFTYSINGDDPVSLDLSTTVEIDMWTGDIIKIDVIASGHSSLTTAWSGEAVEVDPNALVLGANAVSVEAGNREGGSWTFTATEAGTLTATVSNLVVYNPSYEVEGEFVPEEVPAVYLPMVVNAQMSFQINGVKAENGNEGYVNVEADDVVTISLAHNMATQFDATLNLTLEASSGGEGGETGEPDGTSDNPYVITVADLPLTIEEAEPHDLYYSLTVDEACKLKVTHTENGLVAWGDFAYDKDDDNSWYTVSLEAGQTVVINPFSYTGGATYVISLDDSGDSEEPGEPDGSYNNPYILDALYGTFSVELPVFGEAWYAYTATESGVFAVTYDESLDIWIEAYVDGMYAEGDAIAYEKDQVISIFVRDSFGTGVNTDITIVDAAAVKIGDVSYATLTDALAAAMPGDVVTLVKDAVVDGGVVLPVGVNLNLGAYDLTADYLIGFKGSYVIGNPPSKENNLGAGGNLFVDENALILSTTGTIDGTAVLPVWDDTASTPCYCFSKVIVNTTSTGNGLQVVHGESIYFQFQQQFTGAIRNALLKTDGFSDNKLSVALLLEWQVSDDDGNLQGTANQEFVYSDYFTSYVAGANTRFYTFKMTGYTTLGIESFTITPMIKSESGAIVYGETFKYGVSTGTTETENNDGNI